jgi:hypothetical protein
MLAIRKPLLCLLVALSVTAVAGAAAKEPAKAAAKPAAASTITFAGVQYVHRSTMNGRSDFVPASQPGEAWRDRMTIIVRDKVTTREQVSDVAGNLFATVSDLGEVVQAESMPNPRTHETEHFFAAKMDGKGWTQAGFVRLGLFEGKGVLVMYTHRSYGEHSAETSTGWLDRNGEGIQQKLMSWTGLPALAQLKALPQSK